LIEDAGDLVTDATPAYSMVTVEPIDTLEGRRVVRHLIAKSETYWSGCGAYTGLSIPVSIGLWKLMPRSRLSILAVWGRIVQERCLALSPADGGSEVK
jgi:hypothetical protein